MQPMDSTDVVPPLLTRKEFDLAANRLLRGKAAGLDGVLNEVFSVIARKAPDVLISTFQRCIEESVFPNRWKQQVGLAT